MKNYILKNKLGLTIVEVVIASAFLALSVAGILGVLVQSSSASKSIDYHYVATNIAKNRIERIREVRRDRGYAELLNWQETNTSVDRNGVSDPNGEFERTTAINTNYGQNLTSVTVRVRYKRGGAFIPVSTEIVTLISPYFE